MIVWMQFCVLFKYWMFAGVELNDKAKHKKKTKPQFLIICNA